MCHTLEQAFESLGRTSRGQALPASWRQSSCERVRRPVQADGRLLLPVDEAARRLTIGRSLLYELLAAGEIRSIHVGRLRRVPIAALTDNINRRACEQRPPVTSAT